MLWPWNALGSTKRVGMDGAAWPDPRDKLRRGRRRRMRQAARVCAQAQQFSALRARKNWGSRRSAEREGFDVGRGGAAGVSPRGTEA